MYIGVVSKAIEICLRKVSSLLKRLYNVNHKLRFV
jgi:hypothetical protein